MSWGLLLTAKERERSDGWGLIGRKQEMALLQSSILISSTVQYREALRDLVHDGYNWLFLGFPLPMPARGCLQSNESRQVSSRRRPLAVQGIERRGGRGEERKGKEGKGKKTGQILRRPLSIASYSSVEGCTLVRSIRYNKALHSRMQHTLYAYLYAVMIRVKQTGFHPHGADSHALNGRWKGYPGRIEHVRHRNPSTKPMKLLEAFGVATDSRRREGEEEQRKGIRRLKHEEGSRMLDTCVRMPCVAGHGNGKAQVTIRGGKRRWWWWWWWESTTRVTSHNPRMLFASMSGCEGRGNRSRRRSRSRSRSRIRSRIRSRSRSRSRGETKKQKERAEREKRKEKDVK